MVARQIPSGNAKGTNDIKMIINLKSRRAMRKIDQAVKRTTPHRSALDFRLFRFLVCGRVLGSAERSDADLYQDKHTPRCQNELFNSFSLDYRLNLWYNICDIYSKERR